MAILIENFNPKIHKIPMVKDVAAEAISGKIKVSEKVEEILPEVLYESVKKIIFKLANKYSLTCIDDSEDLIQDCVYRVFLKIEQYDSRKGAFTTWVWRVCASVLNRTYTRNNSYNDRFEEWDEDIGSEIEDRRYPEITADIKDVVDELFKKHPSQSDILSEIFKVGDETIVPKSINMSEIAKSLNRKHHEVYLFVSKRVRPFMIEKFGKLGE